MKCHLANHPLPPRTTPHHQLRNRTDSASSSSSSSGEEQEKSRETLLDDKSLAYGLRENPKKSFRESETKSRNPTRRRSKRKPKVGAANDATTDGIKKPKPLSLPSSIDSPELVSSVSDTSPKDDVAMCLMLLSRDAWKRNNVELKSQKPVESLEESE
ncbi:hypothetical protein V6N11_013813 [Hibiscus sabdariffa]|uniref:Uncharacterized protein n=1 Tax=Hibiscus sabdariffa TaxID=183260 RepID=A0ABR2PD20_9ROSI